MGSSCFKFLLITLFTGVIICRASFGYCNEQTMIPPTIKATANTSSSLFAGRDYAYTINISSGTAIRGVLTGRVVKGMHTLAGTEQLIGIGPSVATSFSLFFKTPSLKPNIIESLDIQFSFAENSRSEAIAVYQQRLWVFPPDPFKDKQNWLKQLNIYLYDPMGKTTRMFENLLIPVQVTKNFTYLKKQTTKIIMIGEGAGLTPQMSSELMQLSEKGCKILCLLPGKFNLTLNSDMLDSDVPSLHLMGPEFITKFDKRLDATLWEATVEESVEKIGLKASGDNIKVIIQKEAGIWVWMAMEFSTTGGCLNLCTLPMLNTHKENPTPAYLLYRILQSFDLKEIRQ